MTGYAADGDTWGIPGPQFLMIYIGLALLAFVVALAIRAAARRPGATAMAHQPGPLEVAYLNGGPRLATYAALAALRAGHCVQAGPGGVLTAVSTASPPTGILEWALYSAAGRGMRQRDLAADPAVAGALDRIRDSLERDGWLLSAARRRRMRSGAYLMLAVAALGLARLVAGIAGGRPVGFLVLALVAVTVTGLLLLRTPRASARTRGYLSSLRRANAHLGPWQNPSWATYGAGAAALGVGLYGATALWTADPAFAESAGLDRHSTSSGTTSSGCGSSSSSDSGASSCGSSSCGGGGGGGCGG